MVDRIVQYLAVSLSRQAPPVYRASPQQHPAPGRHRPHAGQTLREGGRGQDGRGLPVGRRQHDPTLGDSRTLVGGWYAFAPMAKKKRRKLRARRSKANHGRRPNAGRR